MRSTTCVVGAHSDSPATGTMIKQEITPLAEVAMISSLPSIDELAM